MPTYEYRCKDCGEDLEVQQSFDDEALTDCPSCGGRLKKRFGAVGISFKGSGFYKTDSRPSGSASSTSSSSTSTSGGDGGTSTTTDGGSKGTESAGSSSSSEAATTSGSAAAS